MSGGEVVGGGGRDFLHKNRLELRGQVVREFCEGKGEKVECHDILGEGGGRK